MLLRRNARRAALTLAVAALAGAAAPVASQADVDPAGCTQTISYDPAITTWDAYWAAHPNPDAVVPLGRGTTGAGGGAPTNGSGAPNPQGRNLTKVLYEYWDYIVAETAANPNVRLIKKYLGKSATGLRDIQFYAASTSKNIENLDGASGDAAFWRGVRSGQIPTEVGLESAATRPAFAWVTATPHGGESAAGESITRNMYELLARRDCENMRRLNNLDVFLQPVRNPDGRDGVTRTTAFGFDPNRDFGTQNQQENAVMVPEMNQYPGLFFIDAHQQTSGYFFPPNEDPVHHEISAFALNFIQDDIGPTLQRVFNDQSANYQNYNSYDLFTPEYGDTVPSLIMGAAGMTYEKGNNEVYGKQVYDHYLAIDTTLNLTSNDKVKLTSDWVRQWGEAVQQGQNCMLQKNTLVSPLHDRIEREPPDGQVVCGYFFKPDQHTGDLAAMIDLLQKTGVRVFKLNTPVAVNGYHEFGNSLAGGIPQSVDAQTLPAGTLWIPMNQGMKHWIQALLGENPYIPYDYFYDVVTWSYPLQRGLSGSGFLMKPLSPGIQMTEIFAGTKYGTVPATASPVYAFNTDSARGLGLAMDLLGKGANVYRATTAFDASGKKFYTGAALVDGASLTAAGVDLASLATLANARNTPITGLPSFPVARRQLSVPKIGLYTGQTTIPSNPLFISGPNVNGTTGHCALSGGGAFCEALHALGIKLALPMAQIIPITSTELAAGRLVNENFTAFINVGSTITTATGTPPVLNANGLALQAFMNAGGNYVGNNAGGTTTIRTMGATTLNTNTIANLLTPGSTYDATINTSNPVAWGFDLGGWIYRDASGNPTYDPTTLGTSTAVVSYKADQDEKYGYDILGTQLNGRPAVVDQPVGAGHAVMLGFNPYYRSWKENDERLVLNAALYPKGPAIAPAAPSAASAAPAREADEIKAAVASIPEAKLPTRGRAGLPAQAKTDRDVRIQVKRADGAKLRAAVKAAKLSKSVKRKLRFATTRTTVTLIVKGVRTSDEHARKTWVSRVTKGLNSRKVTPIYALV